MAGAIVASTLTTSVIFLPLVFARTTTTALFQSLALVVVFAIVCSLLVALTLVPMMASHLLTIEAGKGDATGDASKSWFQRAFATLENRYSDAIRSVLTRRWLVFVVTAVLLGGSVALWPFVSIELAPQTDASEIDIDLDMAQRTNIAVVMEYLDEVERRVKPMFSKEDLENFAKQVQPWGAEVEIQLKSAAEREINSFELADSIRSAVAG